MSQSQYFVYLQFFVYTNRSLAMSLVIVLNRINTHHCYPVSKKLQPKPLTPTAMSMVNLPLATMNWMMHAKDFDCWKWKSKRWRIGLPKNIQMFCSSIIRIESEFWWVHFLNDRTFSCELLSFEHYPSNWHSNTFLMHVHYSNRLLVVLVLSVHIWWIILWWKAMK